MNTRNRKSLNSTLATVMVAATLMVVSGLANAGVIRSADFEDIAVPGDGAVPGTSGSDLWIRFGEDGNGTTVNGSDSDGGNTFGFIDVNSNDPWHAGQLLLFLGPLPTLDLSELHLSADMRTNTENAGTRGEFRIESLISSNDPNEPWTRTGFVEFNPLLDDTFTNVGGFLNAAPISSNFDATAEAFQIVFAFNDVGFNGALPGTGFGSGANNQLYFDNLNFSQIDSAANAANVSEPANVALVLTGLMVLGVRRKRRA